MDDTEALCKLLTRVLNKNGYMVETAADGQEAIQKYKEAMKIGRQFDVVCMDLTIPGGMGGAEAIKELQQLDPTVKAIVFSGYSNDPIMANCKKYGFVEKLPKPFELDELSSLIAKVIES